MSLLIKALASAEKDKQAGLRGSGAEALPLAELGLEPLSPAETGAGLEKPAISLAAEAPANHADSFNVAAAASVANAKQRSELNKDHQRQAAANVFVANQAVKQPTSMSALLMFGVAGALFILLGLQGYQYFLSMNTPPQGATRSAPPVVAAMPAEAESPSQTMVPETSQAEPVVVEMEALPVNGNEPVSEYSPDVLVAPAESSVFAGNKTGAKKPERSIAEADVAPNPRAGESKSAESQQGASLRLLSRTPPAGVDPTLQAAYEAYGRGDDAAAQTQYRQVLQADTRNVDALLGMAAIALRQSRHADANGWYQKVLEIEPRNSTALSAITTQQIHSESAAGATGDYAATESRIKTMLVQQPEAASLHAALGNLYAAQNQWPQAQDAYFNASRYAPNSADYAFNLAVSLDQLGKTGLALAQYQRALSLLNHAGPSSLDKTQLETRIKTLQE